MILEPPPFCANCWEPLNHPVCQACCTVNYDSETAAAKRAELRERFIKVLRAARSGSYVIIDEGEP